MNRAVLKFIAFFAICLVWLFSLPTAASAGVRAAILCNLSTGKILYQHNANAQVAPASLTKIMTMFLAMDAIKNKKTGYNKKIKISREAARVGGSSMRLAAGDRVPLARLLAGMAVASGNDAAMAVAGQIGGNTKNFVRLMNNKARRLGMKRTQFKNPTGLPAAGQKTTARDLLILCRAYLNSHPAATRFHKMLYLMHKGRAARNTNPLLGVVPGVDGLKTGWTVASGYNLIVTAKRGKTRLIAIVLGGSTKRARDSLASRLVQAGFKYPANADRARKFIIGR